MSSTDATFIPIQDGNTESNMADALLEDNLRSKAETNAILSNKISTLENKVHKLSSKINAMNRELFKLDKRVIKCEQYS